VCAQVTDTMMITFAPLPIVNAGPDRLTCADQEGIDLSGIISNSLGGIWSTGGSGFFAPSATNLLTLYYFSTADSASGRIILSTTYFPSAADQAAGSVTLNLTSTGNGDCYFYSDNITITFGIPLVNAGIDDTVCTTNFPVQLNGSGANGTWSGGAGTFLPGVN